jgi:hypothetical protein
MMDVSRRSTLDPPRRISGRVVVVGLFLFGIGLVSLLWIYWKLHTGPFRPLQDALAAEFPGSSPRVEGGQHKIHKGTPKTLRATLRVDFDPERETRRGEEMLDRVQEIAKRYDDLISYEVLEVFLFHGVPEQDLKQREFERNLTQNSPESPHRSE